MRFLVLFYCFRLALLLESPCVIELHCAECLPEHMPLVTTHHAENGTLTVAHGDEVTLTCGAGRLIAYPLLASVTPRCEAGRYRVPQDAALRHLLELGCQESIFEDVLHTVENCGAPLQGRAYLLHDSSHSVRHLAALCFDEDRGLPTFAHISNSASNIVRMPAHSEQNAPLTLLGNFNHMFDATTRHAAETLYSDDQRMNRRLHEIMRPDRFSFASQTLTSGTLIGNQYFDDQNTRVVEFVSNKVAVWQNVAQGNLHHLHRDIAKFIKLTRPHIILDIYTGTHDVLTLRTSRGRTPIFLKSQRFPIPKYIWTLVHDKKNKRALAIVVLNDPFVSVSEIREAVFCESACGRVSWLHELRRHRNYESPVYGLTFCCSVHNFTNVVTEMPKNIIKDVIRESDGLLTEINNNIRH